MSCYLRDNLDSKWTFEIHNHVYLWSYVYLHFNECNEETNKIMNACRHKLKNKGAQTNFSLAIKQGHTKNEHRDDEHGSRATYRFGLVGVFIQSVTADCAGRRGRHGNAATLSRGHDDGRAADAIVMRDIAACCCCCCSSSSCSLVCHWVAPPRRTCGGQHAALWRSRDTGSPLDCNTNRVFVIVFNSFFLFCEDTKGRGYMPGGFVKVLSTVKLYNNSNEGLFLGTKSRLSLRVIAFCQ